MSSNTFLLYFTFVLIALSSAQWVPTQIYSHADGTALATGSVGGPSACNAPLFLLRTSGAQTCIATLNATGAVMSEVCPAQVAGATALSCLGNACYVLNPALQLVAVSSNTSSITTFSISQMTNPTSVLYAYQRNTTYVELYMVDGSDNGVWQFTVSYPYPTIVYSRKLFVMTGAPAGLVMYSATILLYAAKGDTRISTYTISTGILTGPWDPYFGSLELIGKDTYGNFHAYDSSCNCIQILNPTTGAATYTVPVTSTPTSFSQNRNKIYVVDQVGVTKYDEPMNITGVSWVNIKCNSVPGSISVSVTGGDYPVSVYSFPDFVFSTMTYAATVTVPIALGGITAYPIILVDEPPLSRSTYLIGSVPIATKVWTDNSVFPSHTGNTSLAFKFSGSDNFIVSCYTPTCVDPRYFEYYEFWLNVGDGGQNFLISVYPLGPNLTIPISTFQPNTWTQVKINIPQLATSTGKKFYSGIQLTDISGQPVQNQLYIDSVILRPYEVLQPSRYVYAFDACYNYDTQVVPFLNETFSVEVVSLPVSCAANSTISTNLTLDGALIAQLTNGQGPFSYNWSYTSQNSQVVSGMPVTTSYITVYDNALNSTWVDISLADNYSFNATKYFRSPPYSIAFTPTAEGQGIIFQVSPEVDMYTFRTLEFWVTGGDNYGQIASYSVFRSTQSSFSSNGGITGMYSGNYMEIPKGEWIKVSFPLTPTTATKFNIIEFINVSPINQTNSFIQPVSQPTFYIDDVVLLPGTQVLTVTDSTGCAASTRMAKVVSPPLITQSVTVSNAKCFNSSDGSVTLNMGGGVPPYTYSWSTSAADQDYQMTSLTESFVSANATDSNGCEYKPYTATILQPPALTVNYTITPPICYGLKGTASALTMGGFGTYTFSWASAEGSPRVIPQPAPDAIFTDSLVSGFTLENTVQVCRGTGSHIGLDYSPSHSGYCSLQLQYAALETEAGIVGCAQCLSMTKYASIIFWIFAESDEALNSLSVAFTQGSLRSEEIPLSSLISFSANAWNRVTVNLTQVNDTNPDGFVLVSSSPDTMGTVLLDDVVVVPIVANGAGYSAFPGFVSTVEVSATTYFLTIVDGNGCSYSSQVLVPQPDAITISYNATSPDANNDDGSVTVGVQGGTPPYTFLWIELNETTQNVAGLAYGVYTLHVVDANGCTMDMSVIVSPSDGPATIRPYNATLSGGLAALVSVGLLICLFAAGMLAFYWAQFSILGSFLSVMMVLGCTTSFLSALVLLPDPTDNLCLAFPWLLGVGFVLLYGCLFIKTWALYQVWRKATHYQRASLTPGYIMRCLGLALIVEIIFLIIWTVIDPPKVHLVKVVNNSLERQCNTNHVTFWVIFLVGKGAWLIFGAVLSVLSRNIAKEYNESSSIAYAIYNNVLLGAIAIPLAILINEVPGGRLTVEVVIISLAFSFSMVVVFFKIWHTILLPDKINLGKMESGAQRRSNTGSKGSKNSSGSGSSGGATRTTAKESASASATDTSP